MNRLFEATLNGVALSSLAEEIVLLDIVEEPAQMDTQTAPLALGAGMLRTVNRRKSLPVRLGCIIDTQDVARRAEVRDLIASWAENGGTMKINTRPDKILRVVMDEPPTLDSSADWSKVLSLTLTAYAVPYWQSATSKRLSVQTVHIETTDEHHFAGVLAPDGNTGKSPAVYMLINGGEENLTHLKVQADATFIELDGINILPGYVVMLSYSDDGLLEIRDFLALEGDNSLLRYRTAESSDDLMLTPGRDNQIIVTADQPVSGTIDGLEWWL